jgi:hypothetical protein
LGDLWNESGLDREDLTEGAREESQSWNRKNLPILGVRSWQFCDMCGLD